MSRIPFGLCLLLLSHGCASFHSQAKQPAIVGQPVQRRHSPALPNQLGQGGGFISSDDEVVPSTRASESVDHPYRAYPAGPIIELGQAWPLSIRPELDSSAPRVNSPLAIDSHSNETLSPSAAAPPPWQGLLKSHGGRPIEIAAYGQGAMRVLVLGSIYGNEPESIRLIDEFTAEFASQLPPDLSLLVVRTPNPDGLAEKTRTNQNGVDLNRNFPSKWFTAIPSRLTGPSAASEIETQHLVSLIKRFQPQRVIHIRSSIGTRPLLLVNSRFRAIDELTRQLSDVDVGTFGGQFKTASLEEFVSVQSGLELMTIHLPPDGFPQLDPNDLLAIVSASDPSTVSPKINNQRPLSAPNEMSTPAPREALTPDGEKGFVQILPPPPVPNQINNTSGASRGTSPEFFELVPPPHLQ